ncbi:hypothetical protein J6590_023898 [Homalodisca vitripennis]|nr:hypothetical protein J6590_023898 [Homalodisca vitripennis]
MFVFKLKFDYQKQIVIGIYQLKGEGEIRYENRSAFPPVWGFREPPSPSSPSPAVRGSGMRCVLYKGGGTWPATSPETWGSDTARSADGLATAGVTSRVRRPRCAALSPLSTWNYTGNHGGAMILSHWRTVERYLDAGVVGQESCYVIFVGRERVERRSSVPTTDACVQLEPHPSTQHKM